MSAGLLIREGRSGDLDALERMEVLAFTSDRLLRRSLRYFLTAYRTTAVLVAERHETPLGYAMVGFRRNSQGARLFSLAVDPSATRRGIGRALLAAAEAAANRRGSTTMVLEVRAANTAALRLYESAGYALFDRMDEYYEDGATALRFRKALGHSAETSTEAES